MTRVLVAAATTLLIACSPSAEDADAVDTMSLATVDTVKPATDTGLIGATTGATVGAVPATVGTQRKTPATQSKTGTKTAPVDTTNIGRDQAIPINTKDPKVRLPTVDTTKRPPGGA